MTSEYIALLFKKLIEAGFEADLRNAGGTTPSGAEVLSLQRQFGQSLCFVMLADAEKLDFDRFEANLERMGASLTGDLAGQASGGAYLLSVFVSGRPNPRAEALIESAEPLGGQKVCRIFWAQRLLLDKERRFSYSQKQTDDIFNIRAACDAAFAQLGGLSDAERARLPATPLAQLKSEAKSASPFKPARVSLIPMWAILAVNLLLVAAMTLDGGSANTGTLVKYGALVPDLVLRGGEYFRLFTAMFLHAGFIHFLSNALGMYIFYPRAVKYFGNFRLMGVYILAGLFGNCCMALFNPAVAVGASGAVYGVIGATLALAYFSGLDLDGLSVYVLLIFTIAGFAFSFLMPNVGQAAHIGGLLFGLVYGGLYCINVKKKAR